MTDFTLFDEIPNGLPETCQQPTIYATNNVEHGHLLIETQHGDSMFIWTGGTTLRWNAPGWQSGVELTADHLRTWGNYMLTMADQCERRQ